MNKFIKSLLLVVFAACACFSCKGQLKDSTSLSSSTSHSVQSTNSFSSNLSSSNSSSVSTSDSTSSSFSSTSTSTNINKLVTITFNSMGGSECESITAYSGDRLTLPTPTKEGYDFIGWFTKPYDYLDPINSYSYETLFNKNIMPNLNVMLFAGWKYQSKYEEKCVVDGIIYGANTTDNLALVIGYTPEINKEVTFLSKVTINNKTYTVKAIDSFAFRYCFYIDKITFNDSITRIESYGFEYLSNLKEIEFLVKTITIKHHAFYKCPSLIKQYIPSGFLNIANGAFSECYNLSIYCEDNDENLKKIMTNTGVDYPINIPRVFLGINRNQIVETADLQFIINETDASVSGCTHSENGNIIIPRVIEYNNTNYIVKKIENGAFTFNSTINSLRFEENSEVSEIGSQAFEYCSNFFYAILPTSIQTFGSDTFYGNKNLSLYFEHKNYKEFSSYKFNFEDKSNRRCYFNINSDNFLIQDNVCYLLRDNQLSITGHASNFFSTLNIPESISISGTSYPVTSIEAYAFYKCHIVNFSIPSSIKYIGKYAFDNGIFNYNEYENCNYLGNEDNPYFALINVINKDASNIKFHSKTKFILSDSMSYLTNVTQINVPNGVLGIGEYAFSSCPSLQSITLPDSLTYVEQYAFTNCPNLVYTKSTTAKYLGNSSNMYLVLADCLDNANTTLTINSATKIIMSFVCYESKITSLSIPSAVKYIGDSAFYNCTSLTSVSLPNSLEHIGDEAFRSSTKLTSITIPSQVKYMGASVFSSDKDLVVKCQTSAKKDFWHHYWDADVKQVKWNQ